MNSALLNIDNTGIDTLAQVVFQTAQEHGFSESLEELDRKLLMIVGEIIEAQNEIRTGHAVDEVYFMEGKPEGFPIEIADALIRILSLTKGLGINIQEAVRLKAIYNEGRPYKHGKAF